MRSTRHHNGVPYAAYARPSLMVPRNPASLARPLATVRLPHRPLGEQLPPFAAALSSGNLPTRLRLRQNPQAASACQSRSPAYPGIRIECPHAAFGESPLAARRLPSALPQVPLMPCGSHQCTLAAIPQTIATARLQTPAAAARKR